LKVNGQNSIGDERDSM